MATFDLPVTTRQSLVFYIALSTTLFYLGHAIPDTPVHVKVATPKSGDGSLPDQLSLVIQDDSGWETDVVLNRAKYIEPNIPVYTYCGACHKGGSDYQLAELEDNQNVAYYQSAEHQAAFQVTKVDSPEQQIDFLLDGDLVVNGTRYSLNHDFKGKRDDASSSPLSSDEVIYTLHEVPQIPITDDVLVNLPSKLEHRRGLQPPIPGVSGSSETVSSPVFSRAYQYSYPILIDTVAVVDFAKYKQFQNYYGSHDNTLQAMRQHYLSVINGVNQRYQSITSLPYNIEVALVAFYVDKDSSAPWSTERFLVDNGQKVNGRKILDDFIAFIHGSGGNDFYPNDHIFFFTGHDAWTLFPNGNLNENLLGMAHYSTVCDRGSVSINEDNSKQQAAGTAAHELAHALSAKHDWEVDRCETGSWFMSDKGLNFSPCSIDAFSSYISGKLQTAQGQQCLWYRLPNRNVRSSFSSSDHPDQKISLDDQ